MKLANMSKPMRAAVVLAGALMLTSPTPAHAQDYPAPSFSSGQLDSLVSRIALYPDPLLAQVLAAASFPDQIPEAAGWANQHANVRGDQLADEIYRSNLQFDPAVQALLPFRSVLQTMANDMNWTSELGNAVLADQSQVMDAVQRMRRSAQEYGYLRNNQQIRMIDTGGAIEIEPADPSLIYVPVYDPYVVYAAPRPGFFVGGAIGYGPCFSIGAFGNWGWGGGFNWYNHAVVVNHAVWGRTWYNRDVYAHNYGNWDRGSWRNTYSNDRDGFRSSDTARYSNTYSHTGVDRATWNRNVERPAYSNQNQNQPIGRAAYDRSYDRTSQSGNAFHESRGSERTTTATPRAAAPTMQSRSFGAVRETQGGRFERGSSGRR